MIFLEVRFSSLSDQVTTTDTISAPPELCLPNEGYHGSTSKEFTLYDDLTLSEWAVGQLTYVYLPMYSTYMHLCSFCARKGRQLQHPEFKYNFKQKQQDKVSTK